MGLYGPTISAALTRIVMPSWAKLQVAASRGRARRRVVGLNIIGCMVHQTSGCGKLAGGSRNTAYFRSDALTSGEVDLLLGELRINGSYVIGTLPLSSSNITRARGSLAGYLSTLL